MKRNNYWLLLLVSGAGFWSITCIFTTATPDLHAWYAYQHGDPLSPLSYERIEQAPNCSGSQLLCAVYAEGNARDTRRPDAASLQVLALQSNQFHEPLPGRIVLSDP